MKLKLALHSAIITCALGTWLISTPHVHANGALPFFHGTECEAANLTQALRGISWSQRGIKNNSTRPLFVICPIPHNFGETVLTAAIYAGFPSFGGSMVCVVRALDPFDGSLQFTTVMINSGTTSANVPTLGLKLFNFSFDTDGGNRQWSIVCPLDPGESILGYFVGYDRT